MLPRFAPWPQTLHFAELLGKRVGPASVAAQGRGETARIGGVNAELPSFLSIQEMREHDEWSNHVKGSQTPFKGFQTP